MHKKGAFGVMAANPLAFLAASTMGLGVNFLSYYVIQVRPIQARIQALF